MRSQFGKLAVVTVILVLSAAASAQRTVSPEPTQLPVRRVVLYKSGVGFFEHLGNVTGSGDISTEPISPSPSMRVSISRPAASRASRRVRA